MDKGTSFKKRLWLSVTRVFVDYCVFCQQPERDGETLEHTSRFSGIYDGYKEERYHYHESCLRDVVKDPETHGHKMIDLALDIVKCKELREQSKRRDAEWRAMKLQQIKGVRERMFDGEKRP